MEQVEIVSS